MNRYAVPPVWLTVLGPAVFRPLVLGLALVLASCWPGRTNAADVLTQHNDNGRTGANLDETVLNTGAVGSKMFRKLWTLYADGQIVAQPLFVSGLSIDTSTVEGAAPVRGVFNAVIIPTMHNTVYVYDADRENPGPEGRTVPLWATWLGPPRPGGKDIDMWSTNDPDWGILGTPVVSGDKSTLFVVAWHDDGGQGLRYRLHALNMANGADRQPAVTIGAASTDPSQPCKPQSLFNPCLQKQRAALLLSRGVIYVGFGGDGNRGALFAFDAATLKQRAVWTPTPSGRDGGIWQSGQGPAADAAGNVYVMTANGTFDDKAGGENFGNSFVRLTLQGTSLAVADSFTPCNYKFLNQLDLDLGSAGPLLVPETPARIVGGGKEGVLYTLSASDMGRYAPSPTAPDCTNGNAVQQVTAFPAEMHDGQNHYGNIHGSPVFWKGPDTGRVYAWGENSRLSAFRYADGRLQDVDAPVRSTFRPPTGMPGGMLAVSADGSAKGSGVLWAAVPLDGDANRQRGVRGIVLALDAQDVSRTLWTSERFAERDGLGLFAKFTPPTVAGGKVFVATYGAAEPLRVYDNNRPTQLPARYGVAVYGLAEDAPAHTVVNQDRDDVTVLRASTEPLALDLKTCKPLDAGSVDCTDALTRREGKPSLHRVILSRQQDLSGCSLLRVTTASKNGGRQNAAGIGFWSTQATGGNLAAGDAGSFTPSAGLKQTGTATLKGGDPATLDEFVGVANCAGAGADQIARLFKPYMQFEAPADHKTYRNWDLATNYLISRDVPQFDRSRDVLR